MKNKLANHHLLKTLAITLFLLMPGLAQAHNFWLLPSMTVLSGEGGWVTVDAARANSMFYFDHNAMALDGLQILAPNAEPAEAQNRHKGKLRSSFDLQAVEQGTYKIATVDDGLFARYKVDGKNQRWFGTDAQFKAQVPEDAEELQVSERISRAETFVTVGAPTREALKASGRGLELLPDTHPNDLYSGESATFKFLLDGKPAEGIEVSVIRGGSRYRNDLNLRKFTTDADGAITLSWPHAGMYYLEASATDDKTSSEHAPQRRMTYVATLEVLPL